ncbi:hypothetical protein MOV08_19395 [Streptomyces yunnanensis]|uniref:Uncharacterized protein n=1 Tax=Streptomyces yunnanensis TaxID=156453 RepID=A0ABY8A8E0_9ACTN|nr:hypothetical protein [Streptomyces yunnanensis]WEB41228.1 hypothetical protein MOV08_19395 [Streptomyces yunnanensis]
MFEEDTAIRKIRMLCVQLLHRCNVECWNRLHGTRLRHAVDQSRPAPVAAQFN